MALKKSIQLKKREDINKVKQEGEIVHTPLFSVLYLENQKQGPKFGFVVSKKIDKVAVRRNKVRRRLAEAVRILLPKLRKDVYVLVLAKKSVKEADFDQIKNKFLEVKPIFR